MVEVAEPLTLWSSVSSFQHADLVPTKLQPPMPTAPNVLLTARRRRNKPLNAFARKVSTVLRPTHAPWPVHVSDTNTGKTPAHLISYKYSHIVGG